MSNKQPFSPEFHDWEKTIHEGVIEGFDNQIAYHERKVADLQEARREYINRHSLNKVKP